MRRTDRTQAYFCMRVKGYLCLFAFMLYYKLNVSCSTLLETKPNKSYRVCNCFSYWICAYLQICDTSGVYPHGIYVLVHTSLCTFSRGGWQFSFLITCKETNITYQWNMKTIAVFLKLSKVVFGWSGIQLLSITDNAPSISSTVCMHFRRFWLTLTIIRVSCILTFRVIYHSW